MTEDLSMKDTFVDEDVLTVSLCAYFLLREVMNSVNLDLDLHLRLDLDESVEHLPPFSKRDLMHSMIETKPKVKSARNREQLFRQGHPTRKERRKA